MQPRAEHGSPGHCDDVPIGGELWRELKRLRGPRARGAGKRLVVDDDHSFGRIEQEVDGALDAPLSAGVAMVLLIVTSRMPRRPGTCRPPSAPAPPLQPAPRPASRELPPPRPASASRALGAVRCQLGKVSARKAWTALPTTSHGRSERIARDRRRPIVVAPSTFERHQLRPVGSGHAKARSGSFAASVNSSSRNSQ